MDKQQIAHILEKEIKSIDNALYRLNSAYQLALDDYQSIDIASAINQLKRHKQKLESIIQNIVEDAKVFNSPFNR